jgi:hypothetical protein
MATTNLDYRNPTILQVDDSQVTIENGVVTVDLTAGAEGELLAVNNLSDVASAATSLTNLGGTATGVAVFTAANAAAAQTAIGATVTGAALLTAASAVAARTTLSDNVVWVSQTVHVAALTDGQSFIAVPSNYSGTVDMILVASNADPGANVDFDTAIGPSGGPFTAITGGDFTVANAAADGTLQTLSPSAAKTVVGGTSLLQITWTDTAVNPLTVSVSFGITRT